MEKTEKAIIDKSFEEKQPRGRRGMMVWIIVLVIAAIVILWWTGNLPIGSTMSVTSGNSYQAVFLTNNQVYFGKLTNTESQYPVLRDIYYLQVGQALQPPSETPQPELRLIKLGAELHGPEDEMFINRDQILFYEDLKADSQIVKAIEAQRAGTPPAPAQP